MPNEKNLIPNSDRTPSELREIAKKGGKKSGEVRRLRAQERKEWQRLLKMTMASGKKENPKNFTEADLKNLSVSDAMKIELIKKVLHGGKDSLSAYEAVMKYSGIQSEDNAEPQEENSVETFLDALNKKAEDVWSDNNE
ncbi:MAG: hypothetical protein IJ279_04220 [Clostridia bacterium]|nr:hypothetical protein [Clostridia bacterium]